MLDQHIPPEGERDNKNLPMFNISSTRNWWIEGVLRWTWSIHHESTKEFGDYHGSRYQLQCWRHVKKISDTLGLHGIDNINIKRRELIYLYKTNNLKILLSYFKHNDYITYRSFTDKNSAHMLENLVAVINY